MAAGMKSMGTGEPLGSPSLTSCICLIAGGYRVMIHDNQQALTSVAKVLNVSPDMADQVISVSYVKA